MRRFGGVRVARRSSKTEEESPAVPNYRMKPSGNGVWASGLWLRHQRHFRRLILVVRHLLCVFQDHKNTTRFPRRTPITEPPVSVFPTA